jgi:hypothetical protein
VAIFLRGFPLILFLFRMWRKLPAAQKRQALQLVGKHGPLILAGIARSARSRRSR